MQEVAALRTGCRLAERLQILKSILDSQRSWYEQLNSTNLTFVVGRHTD